MYTNDEHVKALWTAAFDLKQELLTPSLAISNGLIDFRFATMLSKTLFDLDKLSDSLIDKYYNFRCFIGKNECFQSRTQSMAPNLRT